MNNIDKKYKTGEFANLLGVSVKTLQRWDKSGKLLAKRTAGDHRYYTHSQYLEYIGELVEAEQGTTIIYARVSNRSQKDDLENQIEFLKTFANARGIIVSEIITDIGSGINFNRKNWNKLIDLIQERKVKTVIVAHKDRFTRFGFDWFERFINKCGGEIIVVNNEKLSPQEELVQDLISIIHVFSCRISGLRKYKKKLEEELLKDNVKNM